jgi:hypothetical protein
MKTVRAAAVINIIASYLGVSESTLVLETG